MWDLPRPGLEPMSPALAGGFLTTAPPGKSPNAHFLVQGRPGKQVAGTSSLCNGRQRSYGRGRNGFWAGKQEHLLLCKYFWLPRTFLPLLFVFSFSVTKSCSCFRDTISYFWLMFNIIKHNIFKFSSIPWFISISLEFPLYVFCFYFVLCCVVFLFHVRDCFPCLSFRI